jgi:pimeloyl-ACP methyl ester carboxylesterase
MPLGKEYLMLHLLLGGALSFAAAAPADQVAAGPAAPPAFVRPPAPGRMVEVEPGRRLHILCKGDSARPAVIFEAGLSQYAANSTYGAAQDAIAPFARVCTYDRAGLGWSDAAPAGWTQEAMARDLHRLLANAGLRGPYVLVAHSLGGLLARTYARTYSKEVAGLVLVDSTTEADFPEFESARAGIVAQIDSALAGARPGIPVIGLPGGTSPEMALAFTPEILRGVKTEFEAFAALPEAMRRPGGFGTLGGLPLIVIRRGRTAQPPGEADARHRAAQEALAAISTDSLSIVAQNSGHTIPLDEPQVVADAVRRMLAALRARATLAGRPAAQR